MSNKAKMKQLNHPWVATALIILVSAIAFVAYPALGALSGEAGFPLDDAWIHQTYARNLAQTGQLAYLPGQPSAGSTSPAWSFLLSAGYMLGIDFLLWAYLLGAACLAATAWLAYRLALRLTPSRTVAALLTGLFCAVEWHLVWAAASGMETMLFTALSLALLEYYFGQVTEQRAVSGPLSLRTERIIVSAVGIGLVGGTLILTRPEGLGLAGLVIAALVVFPRPSDGKELRIRLLAALVSLVSLGVLLAPYIAFNLRTAGSIFPNTFYAKQAEYGVYLQALSLPARFWRMVSPTFVGAQVLLLPGLCYGLYHLIRRRRWSDLLPVVWWLAFLIVYALRLPVNYQHGRYSIPTIPLLILYGVWGTAQLLRPRSPQPLLRVVSTAVPAAIAVLALLFWARGAVAYRDDVAFIQNEMVAIAHWLDDHTATEDIIAVHDIGAVGYVTDRPLLDLAGLITPKVIPFMTDAEELLDWMIEHEAEYAVFFADFSPTYAQLAADPRLEEVHCTGYAWTQAVGHQNLCVYRVSGALP